MKIGLASVSTTLFTEKKPIQIIYIQFYYSLRAHKIYKSIFLNQQKL